MGRIERLGVSQLFEFLLAIPHRDLMPPPELAADAPVLEVFHPVGVGLGPALGAEFDVTVGHGIGGLPDAGVFEEPLHRDARFDRYVGAFGETDVVLVFLHLDEQAHFLEFRGGLLAGDETVESVQVRAVGAVDVSIRREHVDDRQIMAHADLEVRLVVGGRDLESAGAEFDVHMVVRNHRNFRVGERAIHRAADVFRIARILGIHRHRHVTHQSFRAGGGNLQELAGCICEFVFHIIQLRLLRGHDDLLVGQRC